MFLDTAKIFVQSGHGGTGCVSFRHEKYVPRGGPDGGDGGEGGSVFIVAESRVRTLISFKYKRKFKAPNGRPGMGGLKTGKKGANVVVTVPPGTAVYDDVTGDLLADIIEPGQKFKAAKGGIGGRGNTRFKSSTNQAPRRCDPGGEAEARWLRLELKLLADVGLVGLPNAGKSTLLSTVTKARPKVADYPFTTLRPYLGVVEWTSRRSFVIADIPGLIEGAHKGRGLGDRFLKHVERTRVLLHLVDLYEESPSPVDRFELIRKELETYGAGLSSKPVIVVGTKSDVPFNLERETDLRERAEELGFPYCRVSAVAQRGLKRLLGLAWRYLEEEDDV